MIPELNLHINYDCPLNCKYCVQRNDESLYNRELSFSAEEMIQKVKLFLERINKPYCCVNISGGEPLLKFEDIKKLMEYFPQNIYEISTSGYLLTEEKVKFFSKFNVNYILSIDGGEKVTNYLRPLANGKIGYFKQLKQNIPHILYYAPKTRAKLIVSKNLISEIFSTYLELEQLGFNMIFITPNVYENEVDNNHPELKTGTWEDKDWKIFEQQINKIFQEIKLGIQLNKKRCLISNIITPSAKMLVQENDFNPNKVICNVLDFKTHMTPEFGQYYTEHFEEISSCIKIRSKNHSLKTQEELVNKAEQDFKKLTGICPRDENCPYQKTCIYSICLVENLKEDFENIWVASHFQCLTQKTYQKYASLFLNELYHNLNQPITQFYLKKIKQEMEVFKNGMATKTFLSS